MLLPLFGSTQEWKKEIKEYIVPLSCVMVSGIADGFNQYLNYHYDGNSQYWQPDISWTNKYKHHDVNQGAAFPGSRTWLVFVTDGHHLTRFVEHLGMFTAITFRAVYTIRGDRKKWWVYVLEGAGYWLVNRAGFAIGYNYIKIK